MAGFIQNPLSIISSISQNLRDRYRSGRPILKELIQNADDAEGTTRVEFVLLPGLPAAKHPLLGGRALVAVNDGIFKPTDRVAIRSFAIDTKAGERPAIGKFGLGMKSVFHLCEAFFYGVKGSGEPFIEVLNPWVGGTEQDSLHADWEFLDSGDKDALWAALKPFIADSIERDDRVFWLWLPLRTRGHLQTSRGEVGAIVNEFPGDSPHLLSFLQEPKLAPWIAEFLPLLRRVERVRYWEPSSPEQPARVVQEVTLRSHATRMGFPDDIRGPGLKGRVKVSGLLATEHDLVFSGSEHLLDSPVLNNLRGSPLWPHTYRIDELGHGAPVPDKAEPHVAVVWSSRKTGDRGSLAIRWAVFLPLDEAQSELLPCEGTTHFSLSLHGQFFIDAGRLAIHGVESLADGGQESRSPIESEEQLRHAWNRELAASGVLPNVLPALAQFAEEVPLSDADTSNLASALRKSRLMADYGRVLCAVDGYVRRVTRQGVQWTLVSKADSLRSLPAAPAGAPDRPWVVLKTLGDLERDVVFVDPEAPNIVGPTSTQWQEQELFQVLDVDVSRVFVEPTLLEYLYQFLDTCARPFLGSGQIQRRLMGILGEAFGGIDAARLSQGQARIRRLVALVPPASRLQVEGLLPSEYRGLTASGAGILLVPKQFDSLESGSEARPGVADAELLLGALDRLRGDLEALGQTDRLEVMRRLAEGVKGHSIFPTCGHRNFPHPPGCWVS